MQQFDQPEADFQRSEVISSTLNLPQNTQIYPSQGAQIAESHVSGEAVGLSRAPSKHIDSVDEIWNRAMRTTHLSDFRSNSNEDSKQ